MIEEVTIDHPGSRGYGPSIVTSETNIFEAVFLRPPFEWRAIATVAGRGKATLEALMRERIRDAIETIVDEELGTALGAARSQRAGEIRAGYRHGKRERTLITSLGSTAIAMPPARIEDADGRRHEWRSRVIPRHQRRIDLVGEVILGVYLSGTSTRRLRGALAPLLRLDRHHPNFENPR